MQWYVSTSARRVYNSDQAMYFTKVAIRLAHVEETSIIVIVRVECQRCWRLNPIVIGSVARTIRNGRLWWFEKVRTECFQRQQTRRWCEVHGTELSSYSPVLLRKAPSPFSFLIFFLLRSMVQSNVEAGGASATGIGGAAPTPCVRGGFESLQSNP